MLRVKDMQDGVLYKKAELRPIKGNPASSPAMLAYPS